LLGGVQHGSEGGVHPEADIGRPADPLAENPARPVGEPSPALRPATIDAEEEIALSHALLPQESLPNWLNAGEPRIGRARLTTIARKEMPPGN
jgi:hypothetical protein